METKYKAIEKTVKEDGKKIEIIETICETESEARKIINAAYNAKKNDLFTGIIIEQVMVDGYLKSEIEIF